MTDFIIPQVLYELLAEPLSLHVSDYDLGRKDNDLGDAAISLHALENGELVSLVTQSLIQSVTHAMIPINQPARP